MAAVEIAWIVNGIECNTEQKAHREVYTFFHSFRYLLLIRCSFVPKTKMHFSSIRALVKLC